MSSGGAFAVLLVVLVAIVGAVFLFGSGDEGGGGDDPPAQTEYSITYVMNGGVQDADAPATYAKGKYMDLPYPSNGDRFFEGWYSDEACTVPVGAILPSDEGDKVLYASWGDNLVGRGFEMTVESPDQGGFFQKYFKKNYSGTVTWKYSAYNDGAYYIQQDMDISVKTLLQGTSRIKNTEYYWSDEPSDSVYYYKGNRTLTGNYFGTNGSYICEIWESQDDTQYIYRSFYPLRMETNTGDLSLVSTFSKEIDFEPETDFEPLVCADVGITVSDPPAAKIGSTYTLTAYGQDFDGWYINGELFTRSNTLVDPRATPEKTYEARNGQEYISYEEGTLYFEDYGLKAPVTVRFDDGSSEEFTVGIRFGTSTGFFTLIDSKEPVHSVMRLYKEKTGTFTQRWDYDGYRYSMSFSMKYSDVYTYATSGVDRTLFYSYSDVPKYFTVDDPYVKQACSELLKYKGTMTDREFASFVMRFVQTIPYLYDEKSRGEIEFWKFPAETFWDNGGDCEDSSILYCTLMKAMGYDTALILFRDHAMASIHFENDSDNYGNQVARIDGKKYVLVETTGTGIDAWDRDGYQLGDVFDSDYYVSKIEATFVVGAAS